MTDVLVQVLTPIVTIVVGVSGSWVLLRTKGRDAQQMLIDQVQEERDVYHRALVAERDRNEARLDRLYAEKQDDRDHINELKDHIWQRREPPPPERRSRAYQSALTTAKETS